MGIYSKFTIGKYHINTVEIIKLFQVNIFVPVTKFSHLTIWLFCKRRPFQIFGRFRGLFKETSGKNWDFALRKKGREKTRMATRVQKGVTKKRELIFNFKIFKYE